jgi:tight adherence protein C
MPAALLAAGAAVFLAVVTLALALQSLLLERRQAYRTLQALRAMELRPSDLRNRELARPATERLLRPLSTAALAVGRCCTPAGWRDATRRRLAMAGSPGSWDEDRVLVAKVAGLAFGAVAGLAMLAVGLAWPLRLLVLAGLCALGYHVPNVVLANAVQRRQASLRRALPDSIDLLTICVEAGLGFDAALAQVSKNTTGPLADELYRTLQEV